MTEVPSGDRGDHADAGQAGMEILTPAQCLTLLRSRGFGRVAVSVDALPAVFPVSYAVYDDRVYFWTAEGTKLAAATNRAVVAFEIDEVDAVGDTGWSVVVVGQSRVVPSERAADLAWLPVRSWAPRPRCRLVEIPMDRVSGRRIRPGAPL